MVSSCWPSGPRQLARDEPRRNPCQGQTQLVVPTPCVVAGLLPVGTVAIGHDEAQASAGQQLLQRNAGCVLAVYGVAGLAACQRAVGEQLDAAAGRPLRNRAFQRLGVML